MAIATYAKEVGADCVKFQTFNPSALVSSKAKKAPYQILNTKNSKDTQKLVGPRAQGESKYDHLGVKMITGGSKCGRSKYHHPKVILGSLYVTLGYFWDHFGVIV